MSDTVYFAPADRRALILPGLPADKSYTFEVRAYRKVDKDVAAGGVILSQPVATTAYRPESTVPFSGDITGTIQGRSSLQVVLNLENIASDGVLSTAEKPGLIQYYKLLAAQLAAAVVRADDLGGLTTLRNAATTAKTDLDTYLADLIPAWDDSTKHTPIDKAVFRAKFDALNVAIADLNGAIAGKAAQTSFWSGVGNDDGNRPEDKATVGAPAGTLVGGRQAADVARESEQAYLALLDANQQIVPITAILTDVSELETAFNNAGVPTLRADIDAANTEVAQAKTDIATARSDLTAEVNRAKGEEGAIRVIAESAQSSANGNTTRIATEETQRANETSALANRASSLEAFTQKNRKNYIDLSWWKVGAALPWPLNGGRENQIYPLPDTATWNHVTGPRGMADGVWLTRADAGGQAAGGWTSAPTQTLDPDQTYRFMVPIMHMDEEARSSYWGVYGVCDLNGNLNDNPYFAIANQGNMVAFRWYMFVGYVFPRNSVGKTHDGAGIYDMETGEKLSGVHGQNFQFHPDGRLVYHRAYQYYATDGAYQAFGRPSIELVDGTEPPVLETFKVQRLTNARIAAEETARADQYGAIAARTNTLETNYTSTRADIANLSQDNTNRYNEIVAANARIATEETARANADSALANRATTLESSYSKTAAEIGNQHFNLGFEGWGLYGASTIVANSAGRRNVMRTPVGVGLNPMLGARYDCSDPDAKFSIGVGFRQAAGVGTYYFGVVFYDGNGDPVAATDGSGNYPLGGGFVVDSATNSLWNDREVTIGKSGVGPSPYGGTTTIPAAAASFVPVLFLNYTSNAQSVTEVDYFKVIDVTKAEKVNARVATEETTRASETSALANRATTLESQFAGTTGSNLQSRIATEETTRASADTSLANRSTTLEASSAQAKQDLWRTMPPDFSRQSLDHLTYSLGKPQDAPSVQGSMINVDGYPIGRVNIYNNYEQVSQKYAIFNTNSGRRYRMTIRVRGLNMPADSVIVLSTYGLLANGNLDYSGAYLSDSTAKSAILTSSFQTLSAEFEFKHANPSAPLGRITCYVYHPTSTVAGGFLDFSRYEIEDITEVALTNARVATEESARASADSALATRATTLEAGVSASNNSLNANPSFTLYPATGFPTGWTGWITPNSVTRVDAGMGRGGYAMDTVSPAAEQGVMAVQQVYLNPGYYVIEAEVWCMAGNLAGAGITLGGYYDMAIDFSVHPDTNGYTGPQSPYGVRRFTRLVYYNREEYLNFHIMNNWSVFGASTAKTVRWFRASVRTATDGEIKAQKVIDANIIARVATNEGAVATLNGRAKAFFQKKAVVGSEAAFIEASAELDNGTTTSNVSIGGRTIDLYNQVTGGYVRALSMQGGNANFAGDIKAGGRIRFGSGAGVEVAWRPFRLGAADGAQITYPITFDAPPNLSCDFAGCAPRNAGEEYRFTKSNETSTGCTVHLKIITPAASTSYTNNTSTAPGSGPTRQISKSGQPNATNGSYTLAAGGLIQVYKDPEPGSRFYDGDVTLEIWALTASGWQLRTTDVVAVSGTGNSDASSYSIGWNMRRSYDLGPDVAAAGITVRSWRNASTASITQFTELTWAVQGSSGERSATPNGQLTNITVSP